MKPGQVEYIGDGAYIYFDGSGFELRANHHEYPTDRVYIDGSCVASLIRIMQSSLEDENTPINLSQDR